MNRKSVSIPRLKFSQISQNLPNLQNTKICFTSSEDESEEIEERRDRLLAQSEASSPSCTADEQLEDQDDESHTSNNEPDIFDFSDLDASEGEQDTADKQDPFAAILDSALPEHGEGELCELHTFNSLLNGQGQRIALKAGNRVFGDIHPEESSKAALVLTRVFSVTKSLQETVLEVRSPYIKRALRDVIESYPGVNIGTTGHIVIRDEPRCLFHYREELRGYMLKSDSPKVKEHVEFCLQYLERTLLPQMASYVSMMTDNLKEAGIDFDNLWMVFKPGDLVYQMVQGHPLVSRLKSVQKYEQGQALWVLSSERLICDGTKFGFQGHMIKVDQYEGFKRLIDLDVFPFRHHPQHDVLRDELIARGRRYTSLIGIHYKTFNGMAVIPPTSQQNLMATQQQIQLQQQAMTYPNGMKYAPAYNPPIERVILDNEHYVSNVRSTPVTFLPYSSQFTPITDVPLKIPDEDLIVSDFRVPGYALTTKKWLFFHVDSIHDVSFNKGAFKNLVLPRDKKRMISSLVRQKPEDIKFDDLIRGKGKGLIFLLYGEPGVGKTYTGESIADHTQRPLLSLNVGDLPMISERLESNLSSSLELATRWNALVLIDECDVFMEARSQREIVRNELVSVFLRKLEYFEGIMFLTTNRIESIDSAFKSRIHLSIAYPKLDMNSRRKLWTSFVVAGSDGQCPTWMNEGFLDLVSEVEINGRQIRNIVRIAKSLAVKKKRGLIPKDLYSGLDALKSFEVDFQRAVSKRRLSIDAEERPKKRARAEKQTNNSEAGCIGK
ncbi:hypothetical protein BT63DRAFT_380228 [Microthyrium microscopicum]|uniref:AAA+ ATPase domain-containing protein n=1 Tax=Microthyrium microscopicum TaxID=703497 RepID=A0A6A6TWP4_9PEZI|nr:hypothetical protein BT63DRAFT_380228 [Microthyrium microscopicum]